MMHGPCGPICMEDGQCTKKFPKDYAPHTIFSDGGYPLYRRRDDGRIFLKNDKPLDNRSVVPYNAFLLLKYGCHINVEACVSVKSVKYLFKYVYKGHDCANMEILRDTMWYYLHARYLRSPEALHRLFGFQMRSSTYSVDRLPIHIPGMQSVFFKPGEEDEALEASMEKENLLTAWFTLNSSDEHARQFLYTEIPLHYTWSDNKWKRRKRNHKVVTRLYHVSPRDVERYHLRILLLNVPAATSFDDLLSYEGVVCSSFQESCKLRHLIHDDSVWERTIEEASVAGSPYHLREMFSFMLLNCDISDPPALWNRFLPSFIEDHTRSGFSQPVAEHKALAHIQSILQDSSKSVTYYRLPDVDHNVASTSPHTYDPFLWQDMYDTLTQEQLDVFQAIGPLMGDEADPSTSKVFFVDGPGGSGKTYLYTFLIHYSKSHNVKVMSSAMTGIAAILLPDGQTAHRTFSIPVPCLDNTNCRISPSSLYAEQLRQTNLFIIDEASMLSKHQFEAIDRLLRDIAGNDVPFGGKIVLLGGDFRQTLPVPVPKGLRHRYRRKLHHFFFSMECR